MAKKRDIPLSPVRDLIKQQGAKMVGIDAFTLLAKAMVEFGREVANDAIKLVRHGNRVKVTKEDIEFALNMRNKQK